LQQYEDIMLKKLSYWNSKCK